MKQFITILLISLCLTKITNAAMTQDCIDDDSHCIFGDFSLTNHSVDDDSAINCPAENVFGSFFDAGDNKCYGIFDGCFGLGNDEKAKVDCGVAGTETLAVDCVDNPDRAEGDATCDALVCETETDAGGTCGATEDANTAACCIVKTQAEMRAACEAWKAGLYCDASGLKIVFFILVMTAVFILIYFVGKNAMGQSSGTASSAGKPSTRGGYKQIPLRGRNVRTQF